MLATITNAEQILQREIDRLHGELTKTHDECHRLQNEVRSLWSARQDALAQVRSLQARVDHLTDEANRWRPGQ